MYRAKKNYWVLESEVYGLDLWTLTSIHRCLRWYSKPSIVDTIGIIVRKSRAKKQGLKHIYQNTPTNKSRYYRNSLDGGSKSSGHHPEAFVFTLPCAVLWENLHYQPEPTHIRGKET